MLYDFISRTYPNSQVQRDRKQISHALGIACPIHGSGDARVGDAHVEPWGSGCSACVSLGAGGPELRPQTPEVHTQMGVSPQLTPCELPAPRGRLSPREALRVIWRLMTSIWGRLHGVCAQLPGPDVRLTVSGCR